MKVPADQIVIPLVPRKPRNGIRSYHTDHPVWPQPVHDVTNWGTFAIDNNGQIHDLAGTVLDGLPINWIAGGALVGFVTRGFIGGGIGAVAGALLGAKINTLIDRVINRGKIVSQIVPGGK